MQLLRVELLLFVSITITATLSQKIAIMRFCKLFSIEPAPRMFQSEGITQ